MAVETLAEKRARIKETFVAGLRARRAAKERAQAVARAAAAPLAPPLRTGRFALGTTPTR